MRLTFLWAAFAAGLGLASAPAGAAMLDGDAFDIYYDESQLGLFGTPTLAGDTIFFTPTEFSARSLNGGGYSLETSTINLRLVLADGYDLSFLSLTERGDYLMFGDSSMVNALGQIRVFDIDAPSMEVTDGIEPVAALDQTNGRYDWSASADVALGGDGWLGTRSVNVTIENLLYAYTDPSETGLAFVEKKYVGLGVGVDFVGIPPVPEPESYALMLAGLGLIGLVTRRRLGR